MALDFGPLKTLIESEDITEIMINAWNKVFVEHKGLMVETAARFVDQRQFEELIFSILTEDRKSLSQALCFDGILKNGFRYNITMPPMSPRGPSLTIRKFSSKIFTFNDLVKSDFLSLQAAQFIQAAVISRLSIIISGGTGSGKTSFLSALGSAIPHDERIVTIEDVPELRLDHSNWISLQAVQNESLHVSVRNCVTNALRMRPNRIIVGECRKDETFEMLQAMNSGHEGSMTTVHSNSPSDCLSRLESLIQIGGVELPLKQIRYQISKSVDLIIQIKRRLSDGKREVSEITELTGMDHDTISRSSIFERNKAGELVSTGYVPKALGKINKEKQILPINFFSQNQSLKKSS